MHGQQNIKILVLCLGILLKFRSRKVAYVCGNFTLAKNGRKVINWYHSRKCIHFAKYFDWSSL